MLRDVSCRDVSTTILGHPIAFPVCVAPTAMHKMAHHEGEVAVARGYRVQKTVSYILYIKCVALILSFTKVNITVY